MISAPPGSEHARTVTAFVLKGYPRLSETFIAQEIAGLERAGLAIQIWSMRFPTDKARHRVVDTIKAPVFYLPEYLYQEPLRVIGGWWRARRLAGYRAARRRFLADLVRDFTPNRIRRFGQACVLAAELPASIARIHAHFLHTPSSVADYAATMRDLDWSFSAHAKDIWLSPEWEKRGKLARASWGVTCTRYGHDHLRALAPQDRKDAIGLVYHGLDLERFPPRREHDAGPQAGTAACPLTIVSIGRAVEKKGFDVLIDALARLPGDLDWRFVHIGGGPLLNALKARAAKAGICDRIEWRGPAPQDRVIALLREADLFVLASRIASDGDRDGLPNVLMEAQSQSLACIASDVAAIPEFIVDGETGLLVPPGDPGALAAAIERVARDPDLRSRLGEAGHRRLVKAFSFDACLTGLLRRFGLADRSGSGLAAAE